MDYANRDEALIGLARQLADAYGEADEDVDEQYAADAVAEYLLTDGDDAPSEALVALLDLRRTIATDALIDSLESRLAARGPAAVATLLAASLGHVYDHGGPVPGRARATMDRMEERDLVQGLVEVLLDEGDDRLKAAAVDELVDIGDAAVSALAAVRNDAAAGDWATDALADIRASAGSSDAGDTWPQSDAPDDELIDGGDDAGDDGDADPGSEPGEETDGLAEPDAPDVAGPTGDQAMVEAEPGADVVEQSYRAFLERFEGEGGSTP